MKSSISANTILIPYIICEHAIWELMEEREDLRPLEPKQCGGIVAAITPGLLEKAETIYQNNRQFRKSLTNDEKGRDRLSMWFKHWAENPINNYLKTHPKQLMQPF